MTRINAIRTAAHSISWGKAIETKTISSAALGNLNAYVFAAILIVCSVAVGCSSDKPKPVSSNQQIPVAQPAIPASVTAPVTQAESKPAPKKPVVHKRPATVNYADKNSGVTFEYPRRYAIETGDAAIQLVASNPIPMNFVQPGGVALAAVEPPETGFVNTDFSSAFFNVSVHKTLSADQCSEFAVPQPKSVAKSGPATTEVAQQDSTPKSDTSSTPSSDPAIVEKTSIDTNPNSKLLIGDIEFRATEAVSGEGTRQSDSKYFHVYQNGSCYEFALNVTTNASEDGITKHVDRDKVFSRLQQILSTVKINPVVAPEVATDNPTPAPQSTPAQ
jgi:hypothetical protein